MTVSGARAGTMEKRTDLGYRLTALAKVVELGPGRVDPVLLAEAGRLLLRAGDRLRLSGDHTVVALAGGTGSGKSSLFNRISGLELSPTGVRRPTTARTHACVWGLDGAGPLLDWLQIQWRHRFARASALDRGESQLHGLILLDLPDHDSIRALTDHEADRLIQLADLVVWVLDPQKYADAATHTRYVRELAGHEAVTVFALNQADRLAPEELAECVVDLSDLLKSEGVSQPRIVPTSATTGRGVNSLKSVLAESVAGRRAAVQRLEADLDRMMDKLTKVMPVPEAMSVPPTVDAARQEGLTDALCDAVGVPAVGEAMENIYGARSLAWVGWPYARWASHLRPDPAHSLRLGNFRDEIRAVTATSISAQPAEVENAVQALADGLTPGMPDAWRDGVRDAARTNLRHLPQVISDEVAEIAPRLDRVPLWWRLLKIWQYFLVLLFVSGLAWAGSILFYGVLNPRRPAPELLSDVSALPWVALMIASVLGLGLLSAIASRNFVVLGATRERESLEREMRRRISAVAQSQVIHPLEQSLHHYNNFHTALTAAHR
ncbi:GTP-binding protein [Sphaerisporangium aureirubrum]|uniref:GTP-binding protein n=1 Tax=Sphaerisporangium aureirubrum TaxID=1544736 RepID=A0ABW1NT85_9ACTN